MIKTKKLKTASKKIISLLLAIITVLSCFACLPMTASASKINYAGHELHYSSDGREVYCLHYGAISGGDFKKDSEAVKYWNNTLTSSQRKKINNILRGASALGYVNSGSTAKFAAVQKAIWKATGATTSWNSTVDEYYNKIVSVTNNFSDSTILEPSFEGSTYTLSYSSSDKEWSKNLKDSNKTLGSYWNVTDKDGLTVKKTGTDNNTLSVSTKTEFDDVKTIKMTTKYEICEKITADNDDDYLGIMGSQQVVLAPKQSKVTKNVKIKQVDVFGGIRIYKRDGDTGERLEGVQFICTGKSGTVYRATEEFNQGNIDVTNDKGKILWENLPTSDNPYTIHEIVPDGYTSNIQDIKVNVTAGENTKPFEWWDNYKNKGAVEIHKGLETASNSYAGATFTLVGDGYSVSQTTDANGYTKFTNVPIGWYTLYEEPNNSNVIGWQHGVAYIWNGTGYDTVYDYNYGQSIYVGASDGQTPTVSFTGDNSIINYYKRGDIYIHKTDDDGNPVQATFGLYDANDNFITSGTTDANGDLFFCNFQIGNYKVREINVGNDYVAWGVTYVNGVQTSNNGCPVYVSWDGQQSYSSVNVVGNGAFCEWINTVSFSNSSTIVNVKKRGDILIHKIDDDGNPVQATFALYDANGREVGIGTTDANGYLYFCNYLIGNYTLKEVAFGDKYIGWGITYVNGVAVSNNGCSVYVSWDNQTSYAYKNQVCHNGWYNDVVGGTNLCDWANTVIFSDGNSIVNVKKRGDLVVHKTEEIAGSDYKAGQFKNGEGFEITVTSKASDNAMGTDLKYVTRTDANGNAYFCDIPVGTYTVSETNLDTKFVQPDNQTVQIVWDNNTSYNVSGKDNFNTAANYFGANGKSAEFTNLLKMFRVTVDKEDSEFQKRPQGDSTLAGAVYELYKGSTLVGTYTTDENGSFTTDYFVCDTDYILKEKTASEGYLLDTSEHKISHSPSEFTVKYNDTNATVNEDVIKGKIEIAKFLDADDATGVKTPETNAEFQIYLKSSGSYDNALETERDLIKTDEDGFALSKKLPYGTYVVHQTKGTEGYYIAPDFEVYINTNGKVYRYIIQNGIEELYLKVVKVDAETGKVIPYNSAQGAMFQVLDSEGKVVKFKYTYPEITTIDTFTINSEGYLMLPEKLPYGKYYLVEVQAPYGYYNENYNTNDAKISVNIDENGNAKYSYNADDVNKIAFNISASDVKVDTIITGSDIEAEIKYVTVEVPNTNQMGTITVTKQGEVLSSVTELNGTYTPNYSVQGLEGAKYNIVANEDITTPDGTVRYKKGDVVDTITTGKDGIATSKQLYLGEYKVVEIKAPHGYVNDNEEQTVKLTYQGQQYSLIDTASTFSNDRQKCEITAAKNIEVDKLYGIGNNGEITNIKFGLYAAEKITAKDGKVIPKDGLIEAVYVNADGSIKFTSDLPIDHKYYVKEISTDKHYVLDSTKYEIDFTYKGESVKTVELKVNGGKAIKNEIIRGDIIGHKVDEKGRNLSNAKFGLFKADETEFTEKNAYLVSVSAKDGHFEFKDVPYGEYKVVELSGPENYVYSKEPIAISITTDGQEIPLEVENRLAKGVIEITKSGEVFSSVTENADGTYTPNYDVKNLKGVTFEVVAAEDIYSYFGDKLVSKGDVVDTVTTDENGVAKTTELYFGKYYVIEKKGLDGYVLDDTKHEVNLEYEDNDTPVVIEKLAVTNTRQKAEISLTKEMEKDTIFNLGDNNEIDNVVFGLFAGEDLIADNGSVIEKDSLLEISSTDKDGNLTFETDIPYGYKFYVKELATDIHYSLFDKELKFDFTTDNNSASIIEIKINDNKVIINELLRGKVTGYKTDEFGNALAGAKFGLFYADEKDFTESNALLTAVSDEKGKFIIEYIDYGDYVVREISTPEGYVINTTPYPVSITEHEQEVVVKCSNRLIRGSVILNKVDSEYPENTLTGAEFAIYLDTNRNGIYDEGDVEYGRLNEVSAGVYSLDNIPYGYYLIKEITAPKGFKLDDNYYSVFISEDGATYEIKNNGECFINNAQTGSLKIVKTSSDGQVEGFEFLIEGVSDSGVPVSIVLKTNENGEINVSPLRTGTYTITELENELTNRYVLPQSQTITITEGQTTQADFYNRVKRGTIVITKTDVATGKVIPDCKIEIIDEDGNVVAKGVTDENGKVEFLLEYGKYYYREYEAPEGYILDETPHEFEITDDGQIIQAVMTNEAERVEKSPKTGTEIMTVISTLLVATAAFGTLLLYKKRNKKSIAD